MTFSYSTDFKRFITKTWSYINILTYSLLLATLFHYLLIKKYTTGENSESDCKIFYTPEYLTQADYFGMDREQEEVKRVISHNMKQLLYMPRNIYNQVQMHETLNYLLEGPPGTGKTEFVKKVSYDMGAELYIIKPSDILDKFIGESEKNMKRLFDQVINQYQNKRVKNNKKSSKNTTNKNTTNKNSTNKNIYTDPLRPTIILFDEAESFFKNRLQSSYIHSKIAAEFLSQYSRLKNTPYPIYLFIATNMPTLLDPAVKRRFFSRFRFPILSDTERREFIRWFYGTNGFSIEEEELAKRTERLSGRSQSDITAALIEDVI